MFTLPRCRIGRYALAGLTVLAVALTSACSEDGGGVQIETVGSGPPATTPSDQRGALRIAAPPALAARIAATLTAMPHGPGEPSLRVVDQGATSDLVVRPSAGAGDPVLLHWSVVTSAARIDRTDVALAAVAEAARTGPLYVAEEDAPLTAALFAEHAGLHPLPAPALAGRLRAEPEALALIPVDHVTVQVRALALDGVDPVRGIGDLHTYPLTTRVQVEATRSGNAPAEAAGVAVLTMLARPPAAPIRVAFTGDLIPARCVYDQMRHVGDFAAPFRAVAERLSSADLTIGSLDAAISDKGTPIGCRETYSLLAPTAATQGLSLAGYDVITVATNHVKDCGVQSCGDAAFLDTLVNLRAAGVQPVGGGTNLTEARQPAIATAGGVRFAFLGYDDIARYYNAGDASPGTAPLDPTTLADDIRAARAIADVVVVLPQWGEEYTANPTPRQQELARIAIEAGATLIAGNHPHTVQAAAPLASGYVAFALGNFVFDQDWSQETMEGVVMEATFHGPRLAAVQFLPVRIQNRLQPVFLSAADGAPIIGRMMKAAAKLGE